MNVSVLWFFSERRVVEPAAVLAPLCHVLGVARVRFVAKETERPPPTFEELEPYLIDGELPGFLPMDLVPGPSYVMLGEDLTPEQAAAILPADERLEVGLHVSDAEFQAWMARARNDADPEPTLSPGEIYFAPVTVPRPDPRSPYEIQAQFAISISGFNCPRNEEAYRDWLRTAPWRVQLHRDLEAIVGPLQ